MGLHLTIKKKCGIREFNELMFDKKNECNETEWYRRIDYAAYLLDCSSEYLTIKGWDIVGRPRFPGANTLDGFDFSIGIKLIKAHFSNITYDDVFSAGEDSGIPMNIYTDIVLGKICIDRNTANYLNDHICEKLNIDKCFIATANKNKDTLDKVYNVLDNITDLKMFNYIIDRCNDLKEKINESKNEI